MADQTELGKPAGQDIAHDRPSSARDLGLSGAVQRFDELVQKSLASIPHCKGEKMLRALVTQESERLVPSDWFKDAKRKILFRQTSHS